MQIPIKCPICEGKCIVPGGFYNSYKYTGQFLSSSTTEKCRQCNGLGIIYVDNKCNCGCQNYTVSRMV